jgi:hypothetical protein
MVYWEPKEATCHIKLFMFSESLPPPLPISFSPFVSSPPSPSPYTGLPQSSIISHGISFHRSSERNNSWIGFEANIMRL